LILENLFFMETRNMTKSCRARPRPPWM
jgi:hypothetical protein